MSAAAPKLGLAGGLPYLEGQLCRPPAQHTFTNGGGEADATAFIALRGSYRTSADQEPITMAAVAKVGFKDDTSAGGHGPTPDTDSYLKLHLEKLIDPRYFGIDRKLAGPWSAFDLEFVPLNFMGYNMNFSDRSDLILLRTMLSTGTSSWSGYDGEGAVQTLGANAHPDASAPQGSDVEIADLGLAIPYSLIDASSFAKTAAKLPDGGVSSPLNRSRFAYIGPFDSQDMMWRIIEQRGWGMGFVRGRYRLFSRADLLDADDVEVEITPDDIVVEYLAGFSQPELDPALAFTAARARNEGWRCALQRWPAAAHVQFVDGDCVVRDDWIATARHPKTGKLFTEMVYQPMLELLAYLRANGFKTFIVSGGGADCMRPWTEAAYGIPEDIMFGYPVTCANGEYTRVTGLEIDAASRARMDKTLKELTDERDAIAHLLG